MVRCAPTMTKLLILAVLLFASCTTLQQDLQSHVSVRITTWSGTGSGFPLSTTEIITAWHVVDDALPSQVTANGQHPTTIERLGELDAALLTFEAPHGLEPWPLDERAVEPAEPVYVSGWGVGLHWWSEGLGTTSPTRLSLMIAPGDSGSPVLDSDMEVLGIVVARGRHSHHHCWMIPISAITSEL